MHVLPLDSFTHVLGIGCPCHPNLELREETDGQIAWVFVHRQQEKTK